MNNLAKDYKDIKDKRDEKRRIIDYDYANKLKALEQEAVDVESKIKVLGLKNDIKNEEDLHEQYQSELSEAEQELKPFLTELGANNQDPFTVHLHDKIYLDTWLDDEGVIRNRTYHRMS
ncbi:MAG: hypothetical protein EOO43_09585 [Flavobacterium sp.]|nr:MAG: hypothetical protein EOO43_09585 [Flavobacterium sp.]